MENLPIYVYLIFLLTTFLSLWFIYKASKKSNLLLGIFFVWLFLQGFIAYSGFYLIFETTPPRFLLLVLPPVLVIIYLFLSQKGKAVLDKMDTQTLSYLHIVRLPVEIVLWLLFLNKLVPELMTFEGANFDILMGISAPIISYFGYKGQKPKKILLLIWNFIGLVFLFNILVRAVLSAPLPFQRFAFDQPNVGVFYFPFVWLPGFIVPVVLFSHLLCIRKLLIKKTD
jgi:hypothetical protein